MLKIIILDINSKLTNLRLQLHLPGANELIKLHLKLVFVMSPTFQLLGPSLLAGIILTG